MKHVGSLNIPASKASRLKTPPPISATRKDLVIIAVWYQCQSYKVQLHATVAAIVPNIPSSPHKRDPVGRSALWLKASKARLQSALNWLGSACLSPHNAGELFLPDLESSCHSVAVSLNIWYKLIHLFAGSNDFNLLSFFSVDALFSLQISRPWQWYIWSFDSTSQVWQMWK